MTRRIAYGVVFAISALIVGKSVYSWMASRPPGPVVGNDVVYICLETQEVIEGPVEPTPAINPNTGRRTLVPAIYSNATKKWVPAPNEEMLRRNRKMLSQTDGKSPLAFDPPEDDSEDSTADTAAKGRP